MQTLKNKKGFTLMELIVVLIIVAVLMAALLPSLIGWINEARETALRVDGRTAMLAIQSTVTQAAGTGRWSDGAPGTVFSVVTVALVDADNTFRALMMDSALYGSTSGAYSTPFGAAAGAHGINGIYILDGNVVGLRIGNTVRGNRDVDGVGVGFLLVGNSSATLIS